MPDHLPPLKSLSAFNAAAKTLHFSKAAEQLNITQSAVSHQIKNLERFLGCKLFFRQGNKLLLTEQGLVLAQTVNPAFDNIIETCDQLRGTLNKSLQLGVGGAFAVHRLVPQLAGFCEHHQDLDIRLRMLSCHDRPTELGLDILLLDKPLEHVAFECEMLKQESYYPVAVPAIAKEVADIPPNRWRERARLIDLQDVGGWRYWFEQQNLGYPGDDFLRLGDTLMMLQAVQTGQGIALLGESLVAEQLATAALVKLSSKPFSFAGDGFYFCYHQKRRQDPNMRIVRNWIMTLLS